MTKRAWRIQHILKSGSRGDWPSSGRPSQGWVLQVPNPKTLLRFHGFFMPKNAQESLDPSALRKKKDLGIGLPAVGHPGGGACKFQTRKRYCVFMGFFMPQIAKASFPIIEIGVSGIGVTPCRHPRGGSCKPNLKPENAVAFS
jgi:hypothetical protein